MSIVISVEPNTFDLTQLRDLWQSCWDECSLIKAETCAFHGQRGFVIQPDLDQYERLSKEGGLVIVTARQEGRLCGFALGIMYRALHHRLATCGNVDSCYIEPGFRSHIRSMIKKIEDEFTSRGADIIAWPTSPDGSLYSLLKSLGYAPDDVVMEKKICVSPPQ